MLDAYSVQLTDSDNASDLGTFHPYSFCTSGLTSTALGVSLHCYCDKDTMDLSILTLSNAVEYIDIYRYNKKIVVY